MTVEIIGFTILAGGLTTVGWAALGLVNPKMAALKGRRPALLTAPVGIIAIVAGVVMRTAGIEPPPPKTSTAADWIRTAATIGNYGREINRYHARMPGDDEAVLTYKPTESGGVRTRWTFPDGTWLEADFVNEPGIGFTVESVKHDRTTGRRIMGTLAGWPRYRTAK